MNCKIRNCFYRHSSVEAKKPWASNGQNRDATTFLLSHQQIHTATRPRTKSGPQPRAKHTTSVRHQFAASEEEPSQTPLHKPLATCHGPPTDIGRRFAALTAHQYSPSVLSSLHVCTAPPVARKRCSHCLAAASPSFRSLLLRPHSPSTAFQSPC